MSDQPTPGSSGSSLPSQHSSARDTARASALMLRALWAWKVLRDHRRMTDLLARAAALLYPGRSGMIKATEIPYAREFNR